jgi:Domain of unknown function (DUF222)
MFESTSDADLIAFMGEEAREESAAMGRRLALVGELFARRAQQLHEARFFHTDAHVATAAEVSPVQNISHARALGQVHVAVTLRERLPAVARVFCRGLIDYRMVAMIISRTENVADEVMAGLDAGLARHVERWMKLSGPKLCDRLDLWVGEVDPAAVRVPPEVDDSRYVDIDPASMGMAWLSGHLHAADGAALDQRLEALAASVCANDPRTTAQRRADACGPLARGETRLACQCGSQDCPARATGAPARSAVIHVLAEQATVAGIGDKPGYLPGFGVLPAESVRKIAATAKCQALTVPGGEPDPGYRPSATTSRFLRWRDLTCRWPGCDKPVAKADIDHTVPWPYGPTHPSNTKHYCRTHHLIKTFVPGWSEQQLSDGTLVLTAPSGHRYRSQAHGATMFPALAQSTGELHIAPHSVDPKIDRSAMAPRRTQTREQDRRDRINAERRQRLELNAEQQRQHQAWLAAHYKPPPF